MKPAPAAIAAIPAIAEGARAAARARQAQLTKPEGALGRLETLAIDLAGIQGRELPQCERARVLVCAGDHGVVAHGVSAYPAAVTAQMCANFLAGGAAVNVLARQAGAEVEILDVGVAADLPPAPGLVVAKVAHGTRDITSAAAMSAGECAAAWAAGAARARAAAEAGCHALVLGEMGIGNTTAAAALMAGLLGLDAEDCVGRGTGVDEAGLGRKRVAVATALARHRAVCGDPQAALAALGGLEIAALAGAAVAAAERRLAVVVDGFITTAAALAAVRIAPACRPYLLFAHCGAEQAHRRLLAALEAQPLLDLGLRLGEGTGGVLALHLLRASCRTLAEMATFAEAAVAGRMRA